MTLAVKTCPNCQTQNISTAQFCGSCGQSLQAAAKSQRPEAQAQQGDQAGERAAAAQGGQTGHVVQNAGAGTLPPNPKQWHEQASLICGVLSIFLCGALASIPGLYFSWSAMAQAKAQGKSSNLAVIGLVLNILGILITFAMIAVMLAMFVFAASATTDPYSGGYGGGEFGL